MSTQTRAELVQLAQNGLKTLPYLSSVSENMLPAVDVACMVDENILPAHSYVLMAASPIFGELVASRFAQVIKGSCQLEIMTVPLVGTTAEAAKIALQYMYQQCSFRGQGPVIATLDQAKVLATFAHKWNIQSMLDASDAFTEQALTTAFSTHPKDSATHAQKAINWSAFAEKLHLVKTLDCCITWLIKNFKKFPEQFAKLLTLSPGIVVQVMKGVAIILPADSYPYR